MDIAIRLCRMRDGLLPRELSVCTFPTAQNLSVSLMRNGLPFGVLPVCTFPTGAHLSDRCAPFRPVKFLGQIGLCMERRMPQMQKPTPTAEPMAYFGDSVELKR